MQLGGTPAQLVDQVKDGVADVIWTLSGYTAGRFPMMEVFELPFMMQSPEATSKALWDYVQQHGAAEFKDVKPIAFHVHGDGVFHMRNKPITTMADLKGLKVRAPTRQTNKFLAALGATPVGMPVPQVSEALSKGRALHHRVRGADEQGQVRLAAGRPQGRDRQELRPRTLGLHGQDPGGRRCAGQKGV